MNFEHHRDRILSATGDYEIFLLNLHAGPRATAYRLTDTASGLPELVGIVDGHDCERQAKALCNKQREQTK